MSDDVQLVRSALLDSKAESEYLGTYRAIEVHWALDRLQALRGALERIEQDEHQGLSENHIRSNVDGCSGCIAHAALHPETQP